MNVKAIILKSSSAVHILDFHIHIHSHLFITLRVYLEPTTNAALVLHRSWVLIPYRPKFFSGLLLTTAQIVFVFVKIAFMFTSLSAVHIYDFHMFTVI